MADIDAALEQQILDVAQREREAHVHHHREVDYLWDELKRRKGSGHGQAEVIGRGAA